jgi:DNA-binding NarL/FixJ family response regulator
MLFSIQSHEPELPHEAILAAAPPHLTRGASTPPDQPEAELLDLGLLWRDLLLGKVFVLEGYYSEDRCFLAVEYRSERRKRALNPARVAILERILLGESQKSVAIERKLAVSTVALTCSDCLRAMGQNHLASRVPALVVMAAHAARGFAIEPARVYRFNEPNREHWVISAERPDRTLPSVLTTAEAAVTRLLVEGHPHEKIAELRHTSRRTVANQLASGFRKMGISGRGALLSALLRCEAAPKVRAPVTPVRHSFETRAAAIGAWQERAPERLLKVADAQREILPWGPLPKTE